MSPKWTKADLKIIETPLFYITFSALGGSRGRLGRRLKMGRKTEAAVSGRAGSSEPVLGQCGGDAQAGGGYGRYPPRSWVAGWT